MRRRSPTIILCATVGLALLWHAQSGAQALLATGSDAQVTADGLHRVDPSLMDPAWVREDLDLSRYNRIHFLPTAVQFRDVEDRGYNARIVDSTDTFFVSETRKGQVREDFGAAFYEAVGGAEGYELSEEIGRDVLMIRALLADVISGVPPEFRGSGDSGGGTVRWAWETNIIWEANIIMELRDSMSDDVLARTVNRERIAGPVDRAELGPLTSRLMEEWSRLLMRRLEELSEFSSE